MKLIKITAVLMLSVLLLTSCNLGLVKVQHDKTTPVYSVAATGVNYNYAPSCYEAVEVGKKYAKWRNSSTTVLFYEMEGADPTQWMTEEGKTIFYSEQVALPEPEDMDISEILVCVEGTSTVALVSITNGEHIDEIINTWQTAEQVEYSGMTPERNYRVKFISEKYPWMYYNLIYVEYSGGESYLYCRDLGKCVPAGDLIKGYLDGTIN